MERREIRQVWRANFLEELGLMLKYSASFPFIAVDTEFPGFLWNTPRAAPEALRYGDMKNNVDAMNVVQLGLTLFNQHGVFPDQGPTWEFNFSDFDAARHPHSSVSVEKLKESGIDFVKNRREGIDSREFGFLLLNKLLLPLRGHLCFVFFHALYDIGYLVKMLSGGAPLPPTLEGFWAESKNILGAFFDLKYMVRDCPALSRGEISLERMAKVLGIERIGTGHNAGSDSLLTAAAFIEVNQRYRLPGGNHEGILYGIEKAQQRVVRVGFARHLFWPSNWIHAC